MSAPAGPVTGPDRGLSAERTTLAWRRNGLSIVTAGLAIVKGIPRRVGGGVAGDPTLGLVVLGLGLAVFLVGARQAGRRARHASLGRPTAELADLWPVALATGVLALAAVVVVLIG